MLKTILSTRIYGREVIAMEVELVGCSHSKGGKWLMGKYNEYACLCLE